VRPVSEWTLDSLKEHLEREIKDLRCFTNKGFEVQSTSTDKALASAQTAVDKAERLADIRADVQDRIAGETKRQQNEWRGAMNDLNSTMLTRSEYAVQHQMLIDRLEVHAKATEKELSQLREKGNSARVQTFVLTALMTGVFTMLVYLLFIHIK